MKRDVYHYVRNVMYVKGSKEFGNPYPGLLQPLPIPARVWQDISMNFIERLPKAAGK